MTEIMTKNSSWPEEFKEFSKQRITLENPIKVGDHFFSARTIIERMGPFLTPERRAKLTEVVSKRTFHIVPVLENIHDLGNVSAAFRSAEAFGFLSVHLISPPGAKFKSSQRVSKGADKWLDVRLHSAPGACLSELKSRGLKVYATHMKAVQKIQDIDFTQPTAIVLGNEKEGVSDELLSLCDGSFVIPMQGLVQSFNISVAAALIFYHAWQDRQTRLGASGDLTLEEQEIVLAHYFLRQDVQRSILLFK